MVIVRAGLGVATYSVEHTVSKFQAAQSQTKTEDLEEGLHAQNEVASQSSITTIRDNYSNPEEQQD